MKTIKPLLFWLPEIYLLIATGHYWFSTTWEFNFIAIGLLTLLSFVMITRNEFMGVTISGVFIFLSSYMILAVIDDIIDIEEFTGQVRRYFAFYFALFGIHLLVALLMSVKWINNLVRSNK